MKITIQNLSKALGGRDLWRDFSLEVQSGVRLAVVGPNGAGKTTFLRLLAGAEEPDSGRVLIPREARVGYAAQDMTDQELAMPLLAWVMEVLPSWAAFWREWERAGHEADAAALQRLGLRQAELEQQYGYNPEQRAHAVLTGLGFLEEDFDRPVAALSGGWRERARLARPLVAGADVLLLDEPTNHLDLEAVEWLERFLLDFKGVLVFVAHDRVFLDRVGSHVLFLGGSRPFFRKGSFSDFLEHLDEIEEQRQREAKKLADEIGKKMDFVRRFKAKATKARQAACKRRQALRLEKQLGGLAPETKSRALSFKWPEPRRGDKLVCAAVDMEFSFPGGEALWRPLNFHIYRGRKIALAGPNGCGKSTLLKLVAGRLKPGRGRVEIGSSIDTGYFSQHQLETLDPARSVLSEIRRLSDPRTTEEELRSVLGLFLLGERFVEQPVAALSGGEKSRLILSSLFLSRANFLVLDEPTNHLDLESREALIEALEDYEGTVLLVAHDRWLLERVAETVWAFSDGALVEHLDGLAGYEQARQAAAGQAGTGDDGGAARQDKDESKRVKREQAERRNALYRELKPRQDRYAAVEQEMEACLERMAELESLLADPAVYADQARSAQMLRDYRQRREESEAMLETLGALEGEMQEVERRWREEE